MSETATDSKQNKSIKLSRNTPIALVVGCAGFIGSHLTQELLKREIQVIGLDNLATGTRKNLSEILDNKKFYLLEQSIIKTPDLELPRLDYAFFVANDDGPDRANLYRYGIPSFLKFVQNYSPKIVLVSDIKVYDPEAHMTEQGLKQSEIYFAKFIKEHKLNGRIVRLSSVFGPGMKFLPEDKLHRLLKEFVQGQLSRQDGMLDLASRGLFIDDAVSLLIKSVFGGATSHKIYDGALLHPIKLSEIKRALLDPQLLESEAEIFTALPEWPTPNLEKTMKELAWRPRKNFKKALRSTIDYFQKVRIPSEANFRLIPPVVSSPVPKPLDSQPAFIKEFIPNGKISHPPSARYWKQAKSVLIIILVIALVGYGLIYPLLKVTLGQLIIPQLLSRAQSQVDHGDFLSAAASVKSSQLLANSLSAVVPFLITFNQTPILGDWSSQLEENSSKLQTKLAGINQAIFGLENLSQASELMMGTGAGEPKKYFTNLAADFAAANQNLQRSSPDNLFKTLSDQGQTFGQLLSFVSDRKDDQTYLVIVQDETKQRLGGGEIEVIGKVHLVNGQVTQIKFASASALDTLLAGGLASSPEIVSELGQDNVLAEDLSFDPDFPTTAQELEAVYKQGTAQSVNGVISLSVTATGQLIASLGGITPAGFPDRIRGSDLAAQVSKHQTDEEAFLSSTETELFNTLAFLPQQKTFGFFQTLQDLLLKKQILLYANDPNLYAYLLAHDFAGAIKRPVESQDIVDFLGVVSAPQASSSAVIKKSINLITSVDKDGGVTQNLKLSLQNLSAASASATVDIYLSQGVYINSAAWGNDDILTSVRSFSSYSRSGFSWLVPLQANQSKDLSLSYTLPDSLQFNEIGQANYSLDFFKQNEEDRIPFNWTLKLADPLKINLSSFPEKRTPTGDYSFSQGLSSDQQFSFTLSH